MKIVLAKATCHGGIDYKSVINNFSTKVCNFLSIVHLGNKINTKDTNSKRQQQARW